MLKISRDLSVTLSRILTWVFMALLIFLAIVMVPLSDMLIDLPDNIGARNEVELWERILIYILAYFVLAVGFAADLFLMGLLRCVGEETVFSEKSVERLRGVSWCCIGEAVVFALLGIWFQLAFGVAFGALFVGICLRVVKNVIEEATEIKMEHDFTV